MSEPQKASGLSEIAARYDLVLCDVWGVLHNGRSIWPAAADALQRARAAGLAVVMITNAPRPQGPVLRQLSNMNCPHGVYDELVTSGDVTRELVSQLDGPVYHIGPERDYALYEGLEVSFAGPDKAAGIVCTGLFDDYNEHPEEYVERFRSYIDIGLPMICANPDIVVEVVDRLLWCAGALARVYDKLGGEIRIVGKPHAPIYNAAIAHGEKIFGCNIDRKRILAIGDGLPTDIKGAADNRLDALFIANGIHAADYISGEIDEALLRDFLEENAMAPRYWMKTLEW